MFVFEVEIEVNEAATLLVLTFTVVAILRRLTIQWLRIVQSG